MNPPAVRRGTTAAQRDALGAILATVAGIAFLVAEPVSDLSGVRRGPDLAGALLVAGMTLPLAARRLAPVACLVVPFACAIIAAQAGYGASLSFLLVWLATGSAALHTDRFTAIVIGLVSMVMVTVGISAEELGGPSPVLVAIGVLLGALPAAAGDALRVQRELLAQVRERAIRLDRLQAVELERARAQERVQIARDVHDVVGHHLSAISLQASAGRTTVHDDPETARKALEEIRDLSHEALEETRGMLGLLRSEEAELTPSPRLADIADLVARFATTPVEIELKINGPPRDLPVPAETCAFRIVQEALTNVVRHAAPTRATVTIGYAATGVTISVVDEGSHARSTRAGNGIVGMRERAELLGGSFTAGPRDDAPGWRVTSWVPAETATR